MRRFSRDSRRCVTSVPARTSWYQLVNTVYPYDWRVRTFGWYRPSVPGNPSKPTDRMDRSIDTDRSIPIDDDRSRARPTTLGCADVPGVSGTCARRRATSTRDGSTARGDVFIMVRAANANARARAMYRSGWTTAARVGGRRER